MVTIRNNSKAIIHISILSDDGDVPPKDYSWAASIDAQGGNEPHIVRVDPDEWRRLKEHPAVKHFRSTNIFEVFGEVE